MDQKPTEALKTKEVGLRVGVNPKDGQFLTESVQIANFLKDKARVIFSKAQLWKWIAHTKGFDISAVCNFDNIVGVSTGLYWPLQNLYYTFITRVAPTDLQRMGIGKLMRTKQLERLRSRMSELWQKYVEKQTASSSQQAFDDEFDDVEDEPPDPPYFNMPLRVLSLIESTQESGSSQGGFNERVMRKLNFDVDMGIDAPNSSALLRQFDEAFPWLGVLNLTNKYGLTPILFKARTLDT
eukprot:1949003-Pleurochrysis_carterae.AAC.1